MYTCKSSPHALTLVVCSVLSTPPEMTLSLSPMYNKSPGTVSCIPLRVVFLLQACRHIGHKLYTGGFQ